MFIVDIPWTQMSTKQVKNNKKKRNLKYLEYLKYHSNWEHVQ